MKLGMYIMATEPISAAYFINPSHQAVCLCMCPRLSLLRKGSADRLLWQRIHATRKELFETFSMRPVSYQRKVGD
jgi:hypothetical protein